MSRDNYSSADGTLIDYNAYEDEYITGTHISIFIGPVWVEEVVSIQLYTKSEKAPVYNYSSEYFDRVLKGNYMIQGSIGLAYTQAEYLNMIMHEAYYKDMTTNELTSLVDKRKSLFAMSLKNRLLTSKLGTNVGMNFINDNMYTSKAANYVERISTEVELLSLDKSGDNKIHNPYKFKLMVVNGNINDPNTGIEIYEEVEIVSTGRTIANDDQPSIILYDIIGRKMPERVEEYEPERDKFDFDRTNLLLVVEDLADQVCSSLIKDPIVSICDSPTRTSLITKASNVSFTGLVPEKTRFYGESICMTELIYSIEYPVKFMTGDKNDKPISNRIPVVKRSAITGNFEELESESGDPNKQGQLKVDTIDNSHGNIISPDRELTSRYIKAIASVNPVSTTKSMGGSIILPRTYQVDYKIGEMVPPEIVDIETMVRYDESRIDDFTKSILWMEPLGFRSTSSVVSPGVKNEDGGYISETEMAINTINVLEIKDLTQPVSGISYSEGIATYHLTDVAGNRFFGILIDEPRYVDFIRIKETKHNSITHPNPPIEPIRMEKETPFSYQERIITKLCYSGSESSDAPEMYGGIDILSEDQYRIYDKDSKTDQSYFTKNMKYSNESLYQEYKFSEVQRELYEISQNPENSNYELLDSLMSIKQDTEEELEEQDSNLDNKLMFTPTLKVTAFKHYVMESKIKTSFLTSPTAADMKEKLKYSANNGSPNRFEVRMHIGDELAYSNLYKCIYMKPVFVIKQIHHDSEYMKKISSNPEELLSYMLYMSGNCDNACDAQFKYDWTVTNTAGYTSMTEDMIIEGVYFFDVSNINPAILENPELVEIYVFWVHGILPVKTSSITAMKGLAEGDYKLSHDVDEPAGRHVDIFNITRLDAYKYNMSIFLQTTGLSAFYKQVMGAMRGIDNNDNGYTYPVQDKIDKVAAFVTGFAANINKKNLINSILDIPFVVNVKDIEGVGKENKQFKLRDALNRTRSVNISDDNPIGEATNIILSTLKNYMASEDIIIYEDSELKSTLKIIKEKNTPIPDMVVYGLTDDGFVDMLEGKRYNVNVKTDSTISSPDQLKLENYA